MDRSWTAEFQPLSAVSPPGIFGNKAEPLRAAPSTKPAWFWAKPWYRGVVAALAIALHLLAFMPLMMGVPALRHEKVSAMVMVDLSTPYTTVAKPKIHELQLQPPSVAASLPEPFAIRETFAATTAPEPSATPAFQQATGKPAASLKTEWAVRLVQHLEHYKRYPREAAAQHAEGVAYLRFSINRNGSVLSAKLDKSSGFDLLDAEALALVRRANPLPPPPAGLEGNVFDLVLPVTYSLSN